jgi:hypothetical protein
MIVPGNDFLPDHIYVGDATFLYGRLKPFLNYPDAFPYFPGVIRPLPSENAAMMCVLPSAIRNDYLHPARSVVAFSGESDKPFPQEGS